MSYEDFLRAKVRVAEISGPAIEVDQLNPALKPFTQDIVRWAVRGGCRAIFSAFGLHKTATQLEIMRVMGPHVSGHRMIGMPLGVRHVFKDDAERFFHDEFAIDLKFIRSTSELEGTDKIYMTNYESIREGKVDPKYFEAVSLDEADVLRSFGSKTFGEMLFGPWQNVPYRWVATATPSPNEYLELISYAHYLGIMDMGESKTRFFKRNSEHADSLTIHPHKEREFWLWVASWALFIQKPSDLGYSDEGYSQPDLDVRWHEIPSDHADAGTDERGQGLLLRKEAIGVTHASREKRRSLADRIAKVMELRAEDPDAHRIIWHDLEDERRAIEADIPSVVSVYGTQDLDRREEALVGFTHGEIQELSTKPVLAGAGNNFQRHCNWAIFAGIGFKFRDFIQAIHRLQRFQQPNRVRVDLIYTEVERPVRESLEEKWRRDIEQRKVMAGIIQEFGLAEAAIHGALQRSFGMKRREAKGDGFHLVNDDSVEWAKDMATDSAGMILTSIPFSTQYEYTPSYNDFGHTDDDDHFFGQMDFLTPELLRVLEPGRVAAIHVKDRVVPGAITGLGFQSISPFMAYTLLHFKRHGFAYQGAITVVTDVVRENNQTYRLSHSEQCKDGSRMGVGMPEYVLLFRKPPSDPSNGYADNRVVKSKDEYPLARWQFDAHALWRSNGNRLLEPADFVGQSWKDVYRLFRKHSGSSIYDFERDVAIAKELDESGNLPHDFMLLQPWSHHPDVWPDIMRARTLNGRQRQRNREKHICPLQFDIVDRLINRYTNPGDTVYDPFAGIGTVPHQAKALGRIGWGSELNPDYFDDSVFYLRQEKHVFPTLFELEDIDQLEVA